MITQPATPNGLFIQQTAMIIEKASALGDLLGAADEVSIRGDALDEDGIGRVRGIVAIEVEVRLAVLTHLHIGVPIKHTTEVITRLDATIPLVITGHVEFDRLLRLKFTVIIPRRPREKSI